MYYVFFVSDSHNAFLEIIIHRYVRGLWLKVAIDITSLLVMPQELPKLISRV